MGVGEHFLIFHHHHYRHHHQQHHNYDHGMKKDDDKMMNIPKGCMIVTVGHEDEEQKRFVIPVMYVNHPLFMELLKEAEDEYGFHHQGPINIPCHVKDFCNVQGMIDQDHHHHHHHHMCCFKD
ncbi:hypothetical protein L1987_76117 [Smallanthus sonchifolius]|uniref:Uncharacterized protein n=1 Tax=Smallanthus sonchifolius TaxID=185202 RepID=A0ACB9A7N0_9ASTR|nr:hypothetical protein L1987_76117 [Smallanthus sonchifolius]